MRRERSVKWHATPPRADRPRACHLRETLSNTFSTIVTFETKASVYCVNGGEQKCAPGGPLAPIFTSGPSQDRDVTPGASQGAWALDSGPSQR